MIDYKQEIINFIIKNGWELDQVEDDEYKDYNKDDNITISLNDEEVVLLDDTGDFLHIEINKMTLFAVLGYFIHYKYLDIAYKL